MAKKKNKNKFNLSDTPDIYLIHMIVHQYSFDMFDIPDTSDTHIYVNVENYKILKIFNLINGRYV